MNEIGRIIFSASDIVLDNKPGGKSPFPDLQPGQILKATVLETASARNATLLVEGLKVSAKTYLPLSKGDTIFLKVTQTGSQPVLKMIPADIQQPKHSQLANLININRNEPYKGMVKVTDISTPGKAGPTKPDIPGLVADLKNTAKSAPIQKNILTQLADLKQIDFITPDQKAIQLSKALVDIKHIFKDITKVLASENTDKSGGHIDNHRPVAPPLTTSNEQESPIGLKLGKQLAQIKQMISKLHIENSNSKQLQTLAKIDFVKPGDAAMQFAKSLTDLKNLIDVLPSPKVLTLANESENRNLGLSEKAAMITYAKTQTAIRQLLNSIALKSDQANPDFLKNLIQKGGMSLESKLASLLETKPSFLANHPHQGVDDDLKALMLKLDQTLTGKENPDHKSTQGVLDNIEKLQMLNKAVFDDTGKLFLPFPILLENHFKFGQLLIDLNRGGKRQKTNEKQMVKVSVLLEMTQLGPLRADLTIFKKSVSGSFGVVNEEIQQYVRENIPVLKQMIAHHGFTVQDINVMILAPEILENTSLIDEMVTHKKSTVHFVI